jgi:hypothetical protein
MKNLQIHTDKLNYLILNKMSIEDAQIVQANKEPKKFRDYNADDKKVLAKKLLQLSYFVGIKESVEAEQIKMLTIFLCSQFPDLSIGELEQSFYFCCSGKLGDFEHFQNFSPIYVGKVVNAYKAYSVKALQAYNQMVQNELREKLSEEQSKSYDYVQGAEDAILREYERFLSSDKYENFNEIQWVSVKTCVMVLRPFKFLNKEQDEIEQLKDYFLSLPKDKEVAINQIKQDFHVCISRTDKNH